MVKSGETRKAKRKALPRKCKRTLNAPNSLILCPLAADTVQFQLLRGTIRALSLIFMYSTNDKTDTDAPVSKIGEITPMSPAKVGHFEKKLI